MQLFRKALVALLLAVTIVPTTGASASRYLQCAPFARMESGIQLFGRAADWWHQAAGRYARGSQPQVGAILSMAASRSMPVGHVAVVSQIVSDREILLNHANWSRRGGIERNVRAVDVSAAGDWSEVRIWFGPIGDLGKRTNPVNGFIYAGAAPSPSTLPDGTPFEIASAR
jgi:hypothetical protein